MTVPHEIVHGTVRPKYFFLSHPRSTSNLLMTMLSRQSKLRQADYFQLRARSHMLLTIDDARKATPAQREEYLAQMQEGFDKMQNVVEMFERGSKILESAETGEPLQGLASGVRLSLQRPPSPSGENANYFGSY
jgi:hypothetical protein